MMFQTVASAPAFSQQFQPQQLPQQVAVAPQGLGVPAQTPATLPVAPSLLGGAPTTPSLSLGNVSPIAQFGAGAGSTPPELNQLFALASSLPQNTGGVSPPPFGGVTPRSATMPEIAGNTFAPQPQQLGSSMIGIEPQDVRQADRGLSAPRSLSSDQPNEMLLSILSKTLVVVDDLTDKVEDMESAKLKDNESSTIEVTAKNPEETDKSYKAAKKPKADDVKKEDDDKKASDSKKEDEKKPAKTATA